MPLTIKSLLKFLKNYGNHVLIQGLNFLDALLSVLGVSTIRVKGTDVKVNNAEINSYLRLINTNFQANNSVLPGIKFEHSIAMITTMLNKTNICANFAISEYRMDLFHQDKIIQSFEGALDRGVKINLLLLDKLQENKSNPLEKFIKNYPGLLNIRFADPEGKKYLIRNNDKKDGRISYSEFETFDDKMFLIWSMANQYIGLGGFNNRTENEDLNQAFGKACNPLKEKNLKFAY